MIIIMISHFNKQVEPGQMKVNMDFNKEYDMNI